MQKRLEKLGIKNIIKGIELKGYIPKERNSFNETFVDFGNNRDCITIKNSSILTIYINPDYRCTQKEYIENKIEQYIKPKKERKRAKFVYRNKKYFLSMQKNGNIKLLIDGIEETKNIKGTIEKLYTHFYKTESQNKNIKTLTKEILKTF
jgi:hypothetical protein